MPALRPELSNLCAFFSTIAKSGLIWIVCANFCSALLFVPALSARIIFLGNTVNNIAKWDGSRWSALGSGVNFGVYAIAISDSDVYVGGDFTTAGGISANHIAKWNGSTWFPMGSGVNDNVETIAINDSA